MEKLYSCPNENVNTFGFKNNSCSFPKACVAVYIHPHHHATILQYANPINIHHINYITKYTYNMLFWLAFIPDIKSTQIKFNWWFWYQIDVWCAHIYIPKKKKDYKISKRGFFVLSRRLVFSFFLYATKTHIHCVSWNPSIFIALAMHVH